MWANADYPADARRARAFGAEGIGLCRTEHMFFEAERLPIVQRMILAKTSEDRTEALNELLPFQRGDFEGLFQAMSGLPVIIRLIDPPLHEFMPDEEELLEEVIEMRVKGETEGLAAKESTAGRHPQHARIQPDDGPARHPPGHHDARDRQDAGARHLRGGLRRQAGRLRPARRGHDPADRHRQRAEVGPAPAGTIASAVMAEKGDQVDYKFGTMIEIPRAAVTADEIAGLAEFFSFGTNDLTQMTFGYSRDDAERNFLLKYVEEGILPNNPFQTIDRDGVGELMRMCVEKGRKARPDLEVGICGEHGGDPESIELCHLIGNNYVSCSPFRVPVARLAAAQAALKHAPKK